jgi:hypothetical protein
MLGPEWKEAVKMPQAGKHPKGGEGDKELGGPGAVEV